MRIQLPAQRAPHVSPVAVPSGNGRSIGLDHKIAAPIEKRKADPWVSHLVNVAKRVYEKSADKTCPKQLEAFLTRQGCTEIKWFDGWITQAVGYVKDGHRCLVFRGTQQGQDWVIDGLCFYYGSPPRHFGFNQGWANVRAEVVQWLASTESPSAGIYLSGHSLGAATAVVAALDLAKRRASRMEVERVVLFGCPRVGPYEFWKRYDEAGLNHRTDRYEHEDDGICVIPPPPLFMHVGRPPAFLLTQTAGQPPIVMPAVGVGSQPSPVHSTLAEAAKVMRPESPYHDMFLNFVAVVFGIVPLVWLVLIRIFPNSRWVNPTKVTLSRRFPIVGCLLFGLVFLAAHLLLSIGSYSSSYVAQIHESTSLGRFLFWVTTVVEAIVVQQASYCALLRIPTLPRVALSMLIAGLVFWYFPVRRIETVAVPFVLLLIVLLLPVVYRAAGGSPAHFCDLYVQAFSDPEEQKPSAPEQAPAINPDVAKFFLMMERISADPKGNALFWEGLEKIRRNNA